MKIKFLFIILASVLLSCNSRNKAVVKRTETKLFGDSLKIDYTYIGDTIYQKRTDLKGAKADGSDNSFDVKSVWTTLKSSDLDCAQKIKISKNELDYIFCLEPVFKLTQKQLKNRTEIKWNKDSIAYLYKQLLQIKNAELDTITSTNYYMIYHFIRNTDYVIYDQNTEKKVSKIRVENYEATYSGGHIYYLISKDRDTLARYNLNDWMK